MRNINFYKRIFGNKINLNEVENSDDVLKIFDVDEIPHYEREILKWGGHLTVEMTTLKENKRVAYYSDPEGKIFALLEIHKH